MSLDIQKVSIRTSLVSCFGQLNEDSEGGGAFLKELAERSEEICIKAKEYIFYENNKCEFVYIPVSGSVMLERSTVEGSRQVFAFFFTGNLLGLSDHSVYSFSAKTLSEAILIKIPKKCIVSLFEKYPILAKRYHGRTEHILSLILDQLFIMGQKNAYQRLAHFLLDMRYKIGHGTETFYLPMSRQDIADYLGMSLETASRGFSKLKREQLIDIRSNHLITIKEGEQLKAFAQS